jgi:hypothetical protein
VGVAGRVAAGLPPPGALAAGRLRVGHVVCVVTGSTARRVRHGTLAGGPPLTGVTVAFGSPACFPGTGPW